jgi:cell division protein FtsL
MTPAEIGGIIAMQGFAGLSLFSVLLLMALGLAIIFGQMGVINMAHHRRLHHLRLLSTRSHLFA